MIKPAIYAKEILKQGEYRLGEPTEDIEQIFSQISPIASKRNSIDDNNRNNSFLEGSAQKGNFDFSDAKQESTSEEINIIKDNETNSVNYQIETEKDQDQNFNNKHFVIDTEKYTIIDSKILKEEVEENNPKDPIDLNKKFIEGANNCISIHEDFLKIPRRSSRLIMLNEQKSIKTVITKQNKTSNPKKDVKIEAKKKSKRGRASKVKTTPPSRTRSNSNQRNTKTKDKSKMKANNTQFELDHFSDESSIEVISTDLDLNESFSYEKKNPGGKKSQNKNKKHSQGTNISASSHYDLGNLTKIFDKFTKFWQTRFELLENKIKNNKKANNPNNRNAKKISLNEKMELMNKILNLKREQIIGLYKLIKKDSKICNQSELEIDLEKIPDKVLKEIKGYVDDCLIKEKEDFIKNFNILAMETENKINEINATNENQEIFSKKIQENQQNALLGRKRKKCILEDSHDLSESLSSSSSNSFSL